MAADFFRLEKGIHILDVDGEVGVTVLVAAAAPSATTDEDAAERGSYLYVQDGAGVYYKDTAGAGADKWVKQTDDEFIASLIGSVEGTSNIGNFTGSIISDAGSVKAGMQELETDLEALQTSVGIAAEATSMGTYTGSTITDNETAKENIQELEVALEALDSEVVAGSSSAITTITTVDTVLVDDVFAAKWFLMIELDSAPEQRKGIEIFATHDGGSSDATEIDWNVTSIVKVGSGFDADISVILAGSTTSQTMGLAITAGSAVSVKFTRLKV